MLFKLNDSMRYLSMHYMQFGLYIYLQTMI
jgi:hypothetical protein